MSDDNPIPQEFPGGEPRLLTITEAAGETGLSQKALARRIERGTLRAVHDEQGRRVVPRTELDRAGLLGDGEEGSPGGELVLWRDLYERERVEREDLASRERELHDQLVAIVNAGPIRAMRLRRQVRRQLDTAVGDASLEASAASTSSGTSRHPAVPSAEVSEPSSSAPAGRIFSNAGVQDHPRNDP